MSLVLIQKHKKPSTSTFDYRHMKKKKLQKSNFFSKLIKKWQNMKNITKKSLVLLQNLHSIIMFFQQLRVTSHLAHLIILSFNFCSSNESLTICQYKQCKIRYILIKFHLFSKLFNCVYLSGVNLQSGTKYSWSDPAQQFLCRDEPSVIITWLISNG